MASKCHGGQAQEGAQASTSAGGARWGRLDMQGGPGLVRRQLERGRRCPPRPFPQASRARHRGLHCPEDHEDTGPAVSQGHATQVPMRSPRHGIAQDMQMPGTCPGCCQGDKAPGTTASTESLWLGEDGSRPGRKGQAQAGSQRHLREGALLGPAATQAHQCSASASALGSPSSIDQQAGPLWGPKETRLCQAAGMAQ